MKKTDSGNSVKVSIHLKQPNMKKLFFTTLLLLSLSFYAFADVIIDGTVRSIYEAGGNVHVKCRGRGDCVIVASNDGGGVYTIMATILLEQGNKLILFTKSYSIDPSASSNSDEEKILTLHEVKR